jgi:hypothetical protein
MQFFHVSSLLAFHGSLLVLDVPCAPNIEPSNTGRSTVMLSLLVTQLSLRPGFLDLLSGSRGCRGFCTTWDTTEECYLCSDFVTECQPRPQLDLY